MGKPSFSVFGKLPMPSIASPMTLKSLPLTRCRVVQEGLYRNITPEAYHNAWRPDKPVQLSSTAKTYPRIGYKVIDGPESRAISDRFVEDGSYLRLKNITLGYDFPLSKNSTLKSANIYITGQNLLTLTKYTGFDPEITSFMWNGLINGVDWNGPPNAKSVLIGLNLNY